MVVFQKSVARRETWKTYENVACRGARSHGWSSGLRGTFDAAAGLFDESLARSEVSYVARAEGGL